MKAGVLFSGGKDSSLAAILLSRDYSPELNTYVFGEHRVLQGVEKAAEALGFPWRVRVFPRASSLPLSIPSWTGGIRGRR